MACQRCGQENETGAQFCAGCGNALAPTGSEPNDPFINKVVGDRYRIVRRIGEGGMGIVYEAEQKLGSTIRKVAVKTLHAELSQDPSITARFHREVGTVASLEHPNTVRVYDFGSTEDGTLYIAMEFLNGVSLQQILERDGALKPERIAAILQQVAGSLDEAHNKGIVHRDLKPDNVLLVERAGQPDTVKLVDFGIAARTESSDAAREQKLTQQGMVLGTPPYMSPEQFTGKPVDRRSDVYSLGVMTYEMVTGQLPFEADTAWQWATHHMTSKPRSLDELPGGSSLDQAARQAICSALEKNPQDRPATASAFYRAFTEVSAETAQKASATGPGTPQPQYLATQAMAEVPVAAGVAPTEAMPEMAGPASPAPAVVAATPSRRPARGNRGLVWGLVGLGGVLLVAMGVVAMGQDSETESTSAAEVHAETATGPSITAPETDLQAEIPEPLEPEPTAAEPVVPPAPTRPKPAASKPRATPKPSPPKPAKTSTTPKAPVPAVPTNLPLPPAAVPPAANAADPCKACLTAVSNKDLLSAARNYASCTNGRNKAKCKAKATQIAPKLATQQAYNGNCDLAKGIMVAAEQMGVPASRFGKAKSECK